MRAITRRSPEEWLGRLSPKDEPAATAFRAAHPEWIARSFARSLAANDAAEPGLGDLPKHLRAIRPVAEDLAAQLGERLARHCNGRGHGRRALLGDVAPGEDHERLRLERRAVGSSRIEPPVDFGSHEAYARFFLDMREAERHFQHKHITHACMHALNT